MKPSTHRIVRLTLLCALGSFAATPARAAPALPDFKAVDANGDGMISVEEFQAQGGQDAAFLEGDTNKDQRLSQDEFARAALSNDRMQAGGPKKGD
ncbi:MAG: hypothetical protein ACLGG4_03705 [Gammaproteobacteria bacterium]